MEKGYKDITYNYLQELLGISLKTAYNKIKGYSEYSACELIILKQYLQCSYEELIDDINARKEVNKFPL